MKKTYVTNMPNHIGAFLQASRCFAELGVNITRVSYNTAVDSNTLFIDAEGTPEQLAEADRRLRDIGYIQNGGADPNVVLIEFKLEDTPGSVTRILELIAEFSFNISYMSSQQESGAEHQLFKMGLFVEDKGVIEDFIGRAEELCSVRVIDYDRTEKTFDNSIFYNSFVNSMIEAAGIDESSRTDLLVYTNLAMQILDEKGQSPYSVFDAISRFAAMLASCRGEAFKPRISRHAVTEQTEVILIEPPCGSNTAIMRSGGEYLFVDTGYAYYRQEMLEIFRELVPEFDHMKRSVVVTHADVDHCGLLNLFDRVIVSPKSAECLRLEYEGREGFREQNRLHKPYISICKTLTVYEPTEPERLVVPWPEIEPEGSVLWQIGFLSFGDLSFEVYEGKGGHLPGEIVLIDYDHHIAFTGDVYINPKDMTPEQKQYNRYAPILMTSVDTDPALCAEERRAILRRLGAGKWNIFGAHGMKKEYETVCK